jgi:hypothetical protein
LKLAPLTKEELEFIRWCVWEPLRRNPKYKKDYYELQQMTPAYTYETLTLKSETPSGEYVYQEFDTVKEDDRIEQEICEQWRVPYLVPPDTEFEDLLNDGDRSELLHLFWSRYKPLFDDAVTVNPHSFFFEKKYLNVWVNLKDYSLNRIKLAVEKVINEWGDKWESFYGGSKSEKNIENCIYQMQSEFHMQRFLVNLEAPNDQLKKTLQGYIKREKKKWKGKGKSTQRTSVKTWKKRYEVYDLHENEGLSFWEISQKLKIKENTVQNLYKNAYLAIHFTDEYSTKRHRNREISTAELKKICDKCVHKNCFKTGNLCKEIEAQLSKPWESQQELTDKSYEIENALAKNTYRDKYPSLWLESGCKRKKKQGRRSADGPAHDEDRAILKTWAFYNQQVFQEDITSSTPRKNWKGIYRRSQVFIDICEYIDNRKNLLIDMPRHKELHMQEEFIIKHGMTKCKSEYPKKYSNSAWKKKETHFYSNLIEYFPLPKPYPLPEPKSIKMPLYGLAQKRKPLGDEFFCKHRIHASWCAICVRLIFPRIKEGFSRFPSLKIN